MFKPVFRPKKTRNILKKNNMLRPDPKTGYEKVAVILLAARGLKFHERGVGLPENLGCVSTCSDRV